MLQGGDSGARDSVPVYVDLVRGAGDARLPGHVELVQLAVSQADIQASVWSGFVAHLAGGAQVRPVGGGPLYSLHDPHLH